MDKYYGIIYKAINKVNGKIYIGQTIQSLNRRIQKHIRRSLGKKDNLYFHSAIRKYNKENFIWEIIAECNSLEELNKVEIDMIEKYNTFENGYNLTAGGNGIAKFNHTKEAKKKMSESKKGEKNPNYNKPPTEETKKKMSKAHEGSILSEETKKKIGESLKGNCNMRGKHPTEETKKKMSKARMGKYVGSKNPTAKKYIVTTPEGGEIFVHGLREFCRNYEKEELNHANLIKVAQGKYKHTKGYKCRYWEEKVNEV